jgi:hypothetical protein
VRKAFSKGGNPYKELVQGVGDFTLKPVREIARATGQKGIVEFGDKASKAVNDFSGGLIDKASGRDKRIQEGIQQGEERRMASEKAASIEQSKKQAFAENQRIEAERMAVGSKSKTLLTSAMGLDGDEDSISKKALMGF